MDRSRRAFCCTLFWKNDIIVSLCLFSFIASYSIKNDDLPRQARDKKQTKEKSKHTFRRQGIDSNIEQHRHACRKRPFFLYFPYVGPEPVLANVRVLVAITGSSKNGVFPAPEAAAASSTIRVSEMLWSQRSGEGQFSPQPDW